MPENTLKNECFQFFLYFVLLFNRSNMETNKKKIPIMIHHLSLSFSRPLCMIAALRLSLAFALGRPVFARLVTSKSAPPPVFPVDPLFLYLYSLSLISIVQSISPPFLLLFSPCFPQSLTTLSVSCSLPASLCFLFFFLFLTLISLWVNPTSPETSKARLPLFYSVGQTGFMPRPGTLRGGCRTAWKHTAPYLRESVWKR